MNGEVDYRSGEAQRAHEEGEVLRTVVSFADLSTKDKTSNMYEEMGIGT